MKESSFGIIPLQKKNNEWFVFLVQLSSGNHWGFPKGHAEKGEDPTQAAQRELEEETQLIVVTYLPIPQLKEEYTCIKEEQSRNKTVIYFAALVKGKPELRHPEVMEGGYFSLKEAKEKITYAASQNILQKLEKYLCKL